MPLPAAEAEGGRKPDRRLRCRQWHPCPGRKPTVVGGRAISARLTFSEKCSPSLLTASPLQGRNHRRRGFVRASGARSTHGYALSPPSGASSGRHAAHLHNGCKLPDFSSRSAPRNGDFTDPPCFCKTQSRSVPHFAPLLLFLAVFILVFRPNSIYNIKNARSYFFLNPQPHRSHHA